MPDSDLPTPGAAPFHLLTIGPFERPQVRCTLTPDRMMRNSESDRLIEEAWSRRERDARARGQMFYAGPMCRFRSWQVVDGGLHLVYGMTDYRELVGTNISHPEIGAQFGDDYLSNGSGVCSVIETSDGHVIAHRRSERVFEYPGMIDVCGGALEPLDTPDGRAADPFATIAREIEEELAVPKDAVSETVCLGIARDGHSLKPEVLMRTRLAIRADKIPALNGIEHSALFVIPGDPVSLNHWLTVHWEQITPASLACLVAHVACTFATGLAATWQR
jgi:8-oxo-dGTP pyrophosphatase MutT (NUDIX family)